MQSLKDYIYNISEDKFLNESLLSWLHSFMNKVHNNQKKLFSDGKLNMLKMDIKKLKYQKQNIALSELSKDKDTVNAWSDTQLGFPDSSEILKNTKKYCQDTDTVKSNPQVYTFYYDGDNTYYAGVIIYEKDIQEIENYLHIVCIETNNVVDNKKEVEIAMFDQFKNMIKTINKSIVGYTGKDTTRKNRIKTTLKNIGFTKSDEIDELYIYDKK